MALLADFVETFSTGKRYFHLVNFSADRGKREVKASFAVYASKEARDAYKQALLDDASIIAELQQLPKDVKPSVIGPVHDRLMAVRAVAEANKYRAEFPVTITDIDVDVVTAALIYERVSSALINAENI